MCTFFCLNVRNRRLTGVVRGTNLAENLALSRHERVEAGGNPEEVQRRRLVSQPVERRLHLRLELGERLDRTPLRVFEIVGGDIELGAIARREADRLPETRGKHRRLLTVERDALAQLDRCVVVRGADEDETHQAK